MVRMVFWSVLWVLSLGLLDVDILYADGLHIRLHSLWKRGNDE